MDADVVVVGAGFGGYTAALRLARYGKKVALVDRDRVGGVCLLRGCIPSKAMIHAAELFHESGNSRSIGISGKMEIDVRKVYEWKNGIVDTFVAGIEGQCRRAGVELVHGEASVGSNREVRVRRPEGEMGITADNIIIATGSTPIQIPGFDFDGEFVLSSRDILSLRDTPERLCIIGGGAIGLEMGTFFSKLGSQVTIAEQEDRILPFMDRDAARIVSKGLDALGIGMRTGTRAGNCRIGGGRVSVTMEGRNGGTTEVFDRVLVAVGRYPNSGGFGLERLGPDIGPGGFIKVDGSMRTSIPGLYAVGDVAGLPMLAHKAAREGLIAADAILGRDGRHSGIVPLAMFTDPEVSMAGITEETARARGMKVVSRRLYFGANGRAMAMNDTRGFVKLVADAGSRKILGIQIVGRDATNLISEGLVAMEAGMTVDDLAGIIHPHPTLSEALGECARLFAER